MIPGLAGGGCSARGEGGEARTVCRFETAYYLPGPLYLGIDYTSAMDENRIKTVQKNEIASTLGERELTRGGRGVMMRTEGGRQSQRGKWGT